MKKIEFDIQDFKTAIFLKNNQDNKKEILNKIEEDPTMLKWCSLRLRDDEDVVLASVSKDGYCLEYASERLKNNKKIVIAATTQNPEAIKYVSENLRDDFDVIMNAVKKNSYFILMFTSNRLRDNEEIIQEAVSHNGMALKFASNRLQANRHIVLTALKVNSECLQFASDELKDEFEYDYPYKNSTKEEILALPNDAVEFSKLPCKFRFDKDIVLKFIDTFNVLESTSDELRDDYDVVMKYFSQPKYDVYGIFGFRYVSDRLKDNKEVLKAALHHDSYALRYASDRLKDDEEIIRYVVNLYAWNIKFASDRLFNNENLRQMAIERKPDLAGWFKINVKPHY